MNIKLPELCVVALVGISGSGKSSFAQKHFKRTEVLSSDYCRGLVSDDENSQDATNDAFDVLYYIARKRLADRKLTVIDATNIQQEGRKHILNLAKEYHCLPVAIVLNIPKEVCEERNKQRPDRNFGRHVLKNQSNQLRRSLRALKREGFRYIHVLNSEEEIAQVEITRQPLWTDKRDETGPFDIIGDIHGCYDELTSLLHQMGYRIQEEKVRSDESAVIAPDDRKAVFLGDLVDRGPKIPEVLALVMNMVRHETALCVPGNHENKLKRFLDGKKVQMTHGLAQTAEQLEKESEEFRESVKKFIDGLISHYVLDNGKLVVTHAGMPEDMQGRASGRVRQFALYGETTGEVDEYGLPVRFNWSQEYRGRAMVVYGHIPVPEVEWLNNTVCLDTGCVFGGKLTALRYPEQELVSVKPNKIYYESIKPLAPQDKEQSALSAQHEQDDLLDIQDVMGKKIISTRLRRNVTIREENGNAALEIISRFAVNPKWLIYLPPTMSPGETSQEFGFLEHPQETFQYFKSNKVEKVICEEKHMGSRAVIVLCKDEATASKRFGVLNEGIGTCYTRTGRPFFKSRDLEQEVLTRISSAVESAQLWDQFQTDWMCLDCEIMPWSLKAIELLRRQYAAVGTAARHWTRETLNYLNQTDTQHPEIAALRDQFDLKVQAAEAFTRSYQNYCWTFNGIEDLKIAPFHILATEGAVHTDKNHPWHMDTLKNLSKADPSFLIATQYKILSMSVEADVKAGCSWWTSLTNLGGEGMVVKPLDFIASGKHGLLQPAVKCRGPEYLRIIYGPDYTLPEHLEQLRKRGLSKKRSLALREFALGIESLERFVRKEPLRKVHECVFGVLALESEPVDPRL